MSLTEEYDKKIMEYDREFNEKLIKPDINKVDNNIENNTFLIIIHTQ